MDGSFGLYWTNVGCHSSLTAFPSIPSRICRWLQNLCYITWNSANRYLNREALYEDESFSHRQLAALVLSKVYYQLQEYNESMVFALGAGEHFDVANGGEYEETLVAKCVDTYIAMSALQNPAVPLDKDRRRSSDFQENFNKESAGPTNATTASGAHPSITFCRLTAARSTHY